MNLGGRGCSELRLCHCTPAWATRVKLHLKKKKIKKRKEGRKEEKKETGGNSYCSAAAAGILQVSRAWSGPQQFYSRESRLLEGQLRYRNNFIINKLDVHSDTI